MVLIKSKLIFFTTWILIFFSLSLSTQAEIPVGSLLPAEQEYKIKIITSEGILEYEYEIGFYVDAVSEQVLAITNGPDYTMESTYDMDLQLLRSEMLVASHLDAERVGFDHRIANYDPEEEKIEIGFFLNGFLQETREIYPDPESTEIETLGLYLQGLLLQDRTDFHGRLVDLNGTGRYRLDSRLLNEDEIAELSKNRRMSEEVALLLEDHDQIYVFSIGYDGILRWFFPTRFHVVLEREFPHRILAFWGGSRDLLRFHLYQYQQ